MSRAHSQIRNRRRQVAQLLADGLSINEVATLLKEHWAVINSDAKAIAADPNNIDYLAPRQTLAKQLDSYDRLEREAREHLGRAIDAGKIDSANRWFESVRRLTEDRSRLLHQIGITNRATEEPTEDEQAVVEEGLSPRARKLIARIALAEKVGHAWSADLVLDDSTALEPILEPVFEPEPPPTPGPPASGDPS